MSTADLTMASPLADDDDQEERVPQSTTHGDERQEVNDDEDDEDEDDIVDASKRRVKQPEMRADAIQDGEQDDAIDGLFGEGSDEEKLDDVEPKRTLDDADLDSGDDEGRDDRILGDEDEDMEQPEETVQLNIMEAEIARHPVPQPSDGELYQLRVPKYLTFEPRPFDPQHFQPPTRDRRTKPSADPLSTFNPVDTVTNTIRWRHSPTDPSKAESNARILRWSDGSLTMQLASNPSAQYLLPGEPLAPPQQKPVKPTPTTHLVKRMKDRSYKPEQESFSYLLSPIVASGVLRVVGKFTTNLTVQTTEAGEDAALLKLKQSMQAANARGVVSESKVDRGVQLIQIDEDPDMARKRAEQAEKEMLKAERRREQQIARERDRGAIKSSRGRTSGLTIGGLEDDMGMGRRKPTGRSRAKPRGRRGEIYSDDEEPIGRRGHTKEDEYDEEDDFIATSDEEELVEDDDDEEGLGIEVNGKDDEEEEAVETPPGNQSPRKGGSPKRPAQDEGGLGQQGSPSTRVKRRRVIEDDEDED